MLKNIALTLFVVVMGMSWILLVKDKEIEYNAAKTVYLENIYFINDDDNDEDESHLDHDYFEDQEVLSS